MYPDWTKISNNPDSGEVKSYILQELIKRKAGRCLNYIDFLINFVKGYEVLDIGVVEHDISHIQSDNWKHKYIHEHAKNVLGIDILDDEINMLRNMGYNIVKADATSDYDIGKRFDRVVIGDVIEHVENSVKLLKFAERHLKEDGQILVTTPNPFALNFIWRNLKEGTLVCNVDHIAWITPAMALELGRRAGLDLKEYWLLQAHGSSVFKKLLHNLRDIFWSRSELFTQRFIYLFNKDNK